MVKQGFVDKAAVYFCYGCHERVIVEDTFRIYQATPLQPELQFEQPR